MNIRFQALHLAIHCSSYKLEACHSSLDSVEAQFIELGKVKDQLLEQGRQSKAILDSLLADKASILLQGQSKCRQFVPGQKFTSFLGMGGS